MAASGSFAHLCHLVGPHRHFEVVFSNLQHQVLPFTLSPPTVPPLVTSLEVKILEDGK